uniref:Pectinesterase inhibitor domain-containing protein n=1 Tax=Fagus sylvatica TaxID=28930 RepID=A0A2N9HS35_FAGSY
MAKSLLLLVLSLTILSFLTPTLSSAISNDIDWWCRKTPHPKTCKCYYKSHNSKSSAPKEKSEFKKTVFQIALEQSLKALNHNKWLETKFRNNKEKAAWNDCMELYQETITLLNQTLDPSTNCTNYDIQTWLSTALTNLETYRSGFVELNVSDYVLPFMSNNVSALISNTLAINKNDSMTPETKRYKDGFPSWVKLDDRKLLQSSSIAANLVVAQDGSGNYKTITEALNAATKRSGSGRFVIHVKSGVYKKNLIIGSKLTNVMLIGDGLRWTIVTGRKSVGRGSTTFNFATVAVTAQGFIACGITFRNTAGYQDQCCIFRSVPAGTDRKSRTGLQTGWLEWNGNFALNTLYYGEYKNTGPSSSTSQRVKWGGYHVITSASVASQFTIENFIGGQSWLPATGVPFFAGL